MAHGTPRLIKTFLSACLVVSGMFAALLPLHAAHAAALSLSPAVSSVAAGNIITLTVAVDAQGTAINNSSATIQFPTDLLQVISVSKSSSIFSLWVEDPSFSNVAGEVSYNGGITNPGYAGSYGQIISITFRAKKAGVASVLFSDPSVLANDGLGTDVLTGTGGTTLTITSPNIVTTPSSPIPSGPSAPVITSSTHPDQNAWYAVTDAVLEWKLPSRVTTVQTGLDTDPNGLPHVSYTPAIVKKELTKLPDGVSYFHLRYLTASGWSPVATYRLQIDTVPPTNLVVNTLTDVYGQIIVHMHADDSLSGIGHYSMLVDHGTSAIVLSDPTTGAATTTLPALSGTGHTISVQAFDRAGNMIQTMQALNPSNPSAIKITDYPSSIKVGGTIAIAGQASYPNATVSVSLTTDSKTIATRTVQADANGVFHFESDAISTPGIAVVWADLQNQQGDTIASSEKESITIRQPILIQIGSFSTELLSVLVPLIALLFLLVGLIYLGWHKFFRMRARLRRDLEQAKVRVHEAMNTLSKEAGAELAAIEKSAKIRGLTPAEERAADDLRATIARIDAYVAKLMQKIEDTDLS